MKITLNGEIKIIEIAARMGGDFIGSDMVYTSTGFDFLKNVIKVAVREPIDLDYLNREDKISLVVFIFNSDDKERFKLLEKSNAYIIKEYEIKKDMNAVNDSSSRNGYYILKINSKEVLSEVFKTLNMED